MTIRYVVAIVVSCLVTGAGFWASRYLRASLMEQIRRSVHAAAADGTLPKELEGMDLDQVGLEGLDVKLPESESRRLMIADLLSALWFIWVPAIFATSIAVAYFTADLVRR